MVCHCNARNLVTSRRKSLFRDDNGWPKGRQQAESFLLEPVPG
jgi:hypothetical protein